MKSKYFYPIFKLKIKPWIKYLLIKKTEFKGKLSEILEGFSFTLNDTLARKFKMFEVEGNSIQDGEPTPTNPVEIKSCGDNVNLLGLTDGTYSIADEITAVVANGEITMNGTATANRLLTIPLEENINLVNGEQYSISTNNEIANSNVRFRINRTGSYDTILSGKNSTNTITYDSSDVTYGAHIIIRVASGTSLTNFKLKPKLEQGSTATPYSPYGMGSINERIVNKNWLNLTGVSGTNNGVTYNVNSNGKLVLNGTCTSDRVNMTIPALKLNGVYTFSKNYNATIALKNSSDTNLFMPTGSTISDTKTVNDTITKITIYGITGVTFTNTEIELQIELGSTKTDFVPHEEQTYSIPVQQPMRSIGTTRDGFAKVNGVWNEVHRIGHVVADGVNYKCNYVYGFNKSTFDLYDTANSKNLKNAKYISDTVIPNVLCSNLLPQRLDSMNTGVCISINSGKELRLRISTDTLTETEVNQILQTNNYDIIYELYEPTYLPCTEGQIAILDNIPSTYKEQTNIISLDEVEAYLKIQYWESDTNV